MSGYSQSVSAVACGLGSYLPPRIVRNGDFEESLEIADEWIFPRTGIRERRYAGEGVATSDLAVEAGKSALANTAVDVQAVVVATSTPDYQMPATAPEVASRLGLSGVPAFDVSAVCSGFLYALATASGLIAARMAESVLVIGADTLSRILNPEDRNTRVVFGDGAGAIVLRAGDADEPGALGQFFLGSDGNLRGLLGVTGGGARHLSNPLDSHSPFIHMDGPEVARNAVNRMAEVSERAVLAAGWTLKQVDHLVAHQANARILKMVGRSLNLASHQLPSNIERTGNTSAASIPILLDEANRDGRITNGQKIVLTAFGAGMTWGATTMTWPKL